MTGDDPADADPPGDASAGGAPDATAAAAGTAKDTRADAEPPSGPARGAVPASASRTRRRRRAREAGLAYVLVAPALVVFGMFIFYPFLRNFELALYQAHPFIPDRTTYVGIGHALDLLGSEEVLSSLWTTFVFALMTVPVGILLGLALAVAAHQQLKGIAVYRTIFASTVTTSVAVAAVIFGTLFNPQIGWLPYLGLNPEPPLLENPTWALPSVALVTVWQNIGFSFILMSAGLQAVPDEVLEAARIDGARAWRRFWRVTVPMLSPTIFFAVVVGTIMAFQTFGQVQLLTEGGPGDRTNLLAYAIYDSLRGSRSDPSRGAVLSIALFLVTLLVTLFQLRVLERRVHYG